MQVYNKVYNTIHLNSENVLQIGTAAISSNQISFGFTKKKTLLVNATFSYCRFKHRRIKIKLFSYLFNTNT